MEDKPLADILRPNNLEDFVGQDHLVSQGKPLRILFDQKQIFSMLFWGPPGVGKTTLARILAKNAGADFFELSAVSAGKADIRKIVTRKDQDKKTVLFLDEIHRFNKAQQDFLLPSVETGKLILIGATTENPSFYVISPLLSRCRVFLLEPLKDKDLKNIIDRTIKYLSDEDKKLSKDSEEWLVEYCAGDARKIITILENTFKLYGGWDLESLKATLQNQHISYDKKGEEHYNTISSFIKSMRSSNVDASLYYLARMVAAGEDPRFIARRMVVFASEDIGIANSSALLVANAVYRTCETIGYPECQENLAHGAVYLAKSPKDRRAVDGFFEALEDVNRFGSLPIPLNLRNAPTKLMKEVGYGKGYEMYTEEDLLPEKLRGKKYFKK